MKKLIAILFIFSVSFAAFSEEFSLFPNNTYLSDITNYFIEHGWKLSFNKSNNTLKCEPDSEDSYFHKQKITSISFSMNNEGYVETQTLVLAEPARTALEAYKEMMEIACDYQTTFTRHTIRQNEGINYAYYAFTPEYNSCLYMISGIDDMYFITILFGNISK